MILFWKGFWMTPPISQIVSILLYGAAGLCVFLVLFNRFLILLPDSRMKFPAILVVILAVSSGSALAGLWFPGTPWVFVPAIVLCLILAGEVHRVFIRRSCAGSNPIESTPHAARLSNPFTTTDLVTHRFEVSHTKWHGAPLRIVHLTDLHVRPGLPAEYYRRVLDIAEQALPDLGFFTGDFVSKLEWLPELREVLRPIARMETFAVLGNHDYWTDPERIGNVVTEPGASTTHQRVGGRQCSWSRGDGHRL